MESDKLTQQESQQQERGRTQAEQGRQRAQTEHQRARCETSLEKEQQRDEPGWRNCQKGELTRETCN
ncbi:hypothetical protein QUA54_24985 [Microcoleus sp. MOSTC5]|uniref:hypothetical protein n=1 Tax=Microcoleus sp. MOSTC5 TaxID=3055378 RepID=UPI002FD022A0